MESKQKIQILYLIIIVIAILILSFTVTVLLKNIDLLKKDPINYGMEINKYYNCVCYGDKIVSYDLNKSGVYGPI